VCLHHPRVVVHGAIDRHARLVTLTEAAIRLMEITQLIQSYCRLAELEVASGDLPRFPGKGYVALPEDTPERAKEWAEGEAQREQRRAEFVGRLQAVGEDPRAALEGMR